MAVHADTSNLTPGKYSVSQRARAVYSILMFIGVITFVVGLFRSPERIWSSYLSSYFYFVSLALGGLFFTAIQYVAKVGWSVNVRRFAECLTTFLPWGVVGAAVLLFGANDLYIWLNHEIVSNDHILHHKAAYLNWGFFVVRLIVFFAIWLFFSKKIIGNSLKQDQMGGTSLTLRNLKLSVIFVLLFALTYSLFSVDLLMSLQPHWFSTIFGVYCFAGLFQSTIAMICLLTIYAMNKGLLKGFVDENHLHDLGKFLKAFTVFMAYIGFSQFMLIWYANIPEETEFFLHRAHGGWMLVSMALLFFKFVVPFLWLLPQKAKRDPNRLKVAAILILIMQYVDIYWIVYPNFNSHSINFGMYEVGVFLGLLGLFLMGVHKFLAKNSLIPMNDPYRDESMHHHVVF